MFERVKEWSITQEVEDVLTEPLIDMVFETCYRHARVNNFKVESIQMFEIYQFVKNDMRILGLEHMTVKDYTKVELKNDVIKLPYHTMRIQVVDDGTSILMSFIKKE